MKYAIDAPQELTEREREVYERGVHAVTRIRCLDHCAVAAYNRNEDGCCECAACAVAAERERCANLQYVFEEPDIHPRWKEGYAQAWKDYAAAIREGKDAPSD